MKNMVLDAKYLKMETFLLGNMSIIKSMVKGHFIGLICANLLA